LVAIGIVVGIVFNRQGRSWIGRQVAGATGVGDITYALVGIAGSFMGFHIGVILGLLPSFLLYVIAAVGAFVTVGLWRGRWVPRQTRKCSPSASISDDGRGTQIQAGGTMSTRHPFAPHE
jgi:hypothetical protein